MEKEQLLEVIKDISNKPNKVLFDTETFIYDEHEKTKKLIIDLTHHLESLEEMYENVKKEINKRKIT